MGVKDGRGIAMQKRGKGIVALVMVMALMGSGVAGCTDASRGGGEKDDSEGSGAMGDASFLDAAPPSEASDAGGTETADVENEPLMAVDEFPITQGSNPTRVISERLFLRYTGLDDQRGDYYRIVHTGTSGAYEEFLDEEVEVDMIVAQQPSPEVEEQLEGTPFKPIAKDALVFITDVGNPVESLTLDQIRDILSGKTVNWKDVGGRDEPINLFARNETGGSKILLDKYVLRGETVKKVPKKNVAIDMRLMSENVGTKTKNGSTLGFTTYHFAEFSGKRDDVKTIMIDGVKADPDSIRRDEYPLVSQIFMGVRDEDSPAGEIYRWITTTEGQELVGETGYVPL